MAAAYIIDPSIPRCTIPHNGGSRPRDRSKTNLYVKVLNSVRFGGDARQLLAHVVCQELVCYLTCSPNSFLRRNLPRNRLIHLS